MVDPYSHEERVAVGQLPRAHCLQVDPLQLEAYFDVNKPEVEEVER